jgi:hypothetical protein
MNGKSSILAKIKELFAEAKMAKDYTAANNNQIIRVYGELKVGDKVAEVAGELESALPDGTYLLNNGKSITVSAGEITEINEYKAEENMKKENMEDCKETMADEYKNEIASKLLDGTEVKILSKGDALSVGDEVLVKDAEGNFIKAPAGKHELEGGLTIYVDELGFINELETAETDKTTEKDEEMKTMFEAVSTMKAMLDELKSSIADMKNENTELKERFNKFAAEPSVASIKTKQEAFSKANDKLEKAKFFGGR